MLQEGNYLISAAGSIPSSRPESSSTTHVSNSSPLHRAASNDYHSPASSAGGSPVRAGSLRAAGGYSNASSRQATPPLASLVGSLDDASEPEAAAYYQAQHVGAGSRLGGHRPGSQKKHRGELGTFTLSERSTLTDKPRSRVVQ